SGRRWFPSRGRRRNRPGGTSARLVRSYFKGSGPPFAVSAALSLGPFGTPLSIAFAAAGVAARLAIGPDGKAPDVARPARMGGRLMMSPSVVACGARGRESRLATVAL